MDLLTAYTLMEFEFGETQTNKYDNMKKNRIVMKPINYKRIVCLDAICLIIALFYFSSCNDDAPTLNEAERVTKLLANGTWSLSSVLVDDTDASELFEDFSITFTETSYTTTGTTPVWERNGMWSFVNADSPTQFIREDDVVVTIAAIEERMLTLELLWTTQTISGGRQLSIKGKHVFVLIR
jgi:hypothetical protein